ncbi:MAG: adenylate kinase family protein, partial [Gemmatimonadales bacterium]
MNIILLGPPGVGKGTQGDLLAAHLGIPKISTGDLLRTAVRDGTELGRNAQSYMDQGLLVPDGIILGLIKQVLESEEASGGGVLMDGFPRTVAQAEAIEKLFSAKGYAVDRVLTFAVPDEELVARML